MTVKMQLIRRLMRVVMRLIGGSKLVVDYDKFNLWYDQATPEELESFKRQQIKALKDRYPDDTPQ